MDVEMLNSGNVNSEPRNIVTAKYEKYAFIIVVNVVFVLIYRPVILRAWCTVSLKRQKL